MALNLLIVQFLFKTKCFLKIKWY